MRTSRVRIALFGLGKIVVRANARCELQQPEILAALNSKLTPHQKDESERRAPNGGFVQNKTIRVYVVRLGCIKAAAWKYNTESGVRLNVTFCRLYKNGVQRAVRFRFTIPGRVQDHHEG